MIKNKKGAPLAIVLLVVFALVISAAALFYFSVSERNINEKLHTSFALSKVYEQEKIADFYIQDVIDKAFAKSNNKEEFIANAKEVLSYYKDNNGNFAVSYFDEIEEQLTPDKIEFSSDKAVVKELKIIIRDSFSRDNEKVLFATYSYVKSFESKS